MHRNKTIFNGYKLNVKLFTHKCLELLQWLSDSYTFLYLKVSMFYPIFLLCIGRNKIRVKFPIKGSIQKHADALISLLESCLSHSLRPSGRGDPPHAKMASDIMSCIFLNYSKRDVMIQAIPVAVKFLHKGNKELSRNLSSYMSLAVIENADILSRYIQPVLDSVITG